MWDYWHGVCCKTAAKEESGAKPTCKTVLTSSQWPVTILAKPSAQKRQVMHQPAPGKPYVEPNIIIIKGQWLKVVEKFTYLGITVSKSIVMDDEVNTRLAKVSAAFGQLNRNVWNWRGIFEATKIKVYQAVILTNSLYGCEMWTTYQWHIKKLNHFHTSCLRKILCITWQKHIPDTKVLTQASHSNIYTILMQSQLCWAGHVALWWAGSGQALPRRSEKVLQGHTQGLHEIFWYHP